MAGKDARDCLVGLELSGSRIRIAALVGSSAGSADIGRLRCEELVIPDVEPNASGGLRPASALAPILKAALSRLGVASGRAAITIGKPHIVLRHFAWADGEDRDELDQVAQRSLGYVQLGPGDRVTADLYHRITEDRVHGLLAVSTVTAISPLTESLREARLRVSTIEPALTALIRSALLTRELPPEPSFLVSVDSPGIAIALFLNGHLLLSHHPASPASNREEDSANPESPEASCDLRRELERMSRHHERAHGATDKVRRVLVTGREDLAQSCALTLQDSADLDVEVITFDNEIAKALHVSPEDVRGQESHAAAIGAAASLLPDVKEVAFPNLASESEDKPRPPFEALLRALLVPTVVAVGLWGLAHFAQEHVTAKVAELRIEAERPSPAENKHREFKMKLTRLEQRGIQLTRLDEGFKDRHWKELVDMVRICVPEDLWLTRIRLSGSQALTVDGATSEESLIYEFAHNIEGSPLFTSATVVNQKSARRKNDIVSEFVIECTFGHELPESDTTRL